MWNAALPDTTAAADPIALVPSKNCTEPAAVAGLKQQRPVVAEAGATSWLVRAVDITTTQDRLSMTFRGQQDQSASVLFDAMGLRQWLSILHRAWSTAQWPTPVWPDWIRRDETAPPDAIRH